MRFRGLDATGDWQLGQGLGSYAQAQAALALNVQTRLLSRKGNCFFALADGVDYTNLMEKGQQAALLAALSNELLQTDGVVKINTANLNFEPRTRAGAFKYDVATIFTKSYQATISNLTGAPQ